MSSGATLQGQVAATSYPEPANPTPAWSAPDTTVSQRGDAEAQLRIPRRLVAFPPKDGREQAHEAFPLVSRGVLAVVGGPEASWAARGPGKAKGTQERACCKGAIGLPSQRIGLEENLSRTPTMAGRSPSSIPWCWQHDSSLNPAR
jgi:hypothetical protein